MATDISPAKPIQPHPSYAKILRTDETFASPRGQDSSDRLNGWFDRLMVQSGVDMAPSMLLLTTLCAALAFGGIAFVLQENLITTALGGLIGFGLPVITLVIMRRNRQNKMLRQLPGMIGELARAARTGRSLEQCFQVVAEDTPNPLGAEMELCQRKLQMGLGPDLALRDLPERTGITSLHVLVTALTVHHETGGDLVSVLERLARTIRDRINFLGRLKAATAASRATAVLMLALPPMILAFLIFRDPEYFQNLLDSEWGLRATIAAAVLQLFGSIWVLRILSTSQRT